MVTPSCMLAIPEESRAQGRDPRNGPLGVGIFGAERWANAMRGAIEDAFDKHAVDSNGLSEKTGPGVANKCVETWDGRHASEYRFFPEVIDPSSGLTVATVRLGSLCSRC